MSARDKFGLEYGDYRYSGILSYENKVLQSVFKSNKGDFKNPPLHKRIVKTCEMQAVPLPMTGNYLPSGPDIEIDDSQYTYGLEKTQSSESESQTTELDTCNSNISTEPSELVSEVVVNESNIEVKPKVWSDAPIIEEYESDSDDKCVSVQTKGLDTPSFANKQVKTPRENVKNQSTHSQKPKTRLTYLADYQDINGGPVAFGGSKGYITGKGKIKTGKLDFEDVSFVKELQPFNLFSVSQMCDKKNKVLFTDTECLVLSPDFKLPDENQILLKVPRQNNMYSFNLENIVPLGGLACLIAKATTDESNLWHRRLGHVNFKNLNRLVKGNLVRGLPTKLFQNDHTCVACLKGKQHKASCKAKLVSSISHTLQLLHMDLFGPTSVRSVNHKTYCLVITDDFSRFSWTFFLRTKDETSAILKDFIRQIENQLNQKVKTIRCDNGTEFKNRDVIEFCGLKGIKREYSNARTPQQNGVAERKNMTLIEAARTMLADSFLPNTFWAEAVSTACYVLNRVLVTKPHNKTPYELLTGKTPIISYIRPFGCHVTILNTIDHLGKFAGKSDEGFLVGYSLQSKAFRVYNLETKRVEENLHINFLENKPNVAGKGPNWLFDLDYLTDSMNYHSVRSENQANLHAGQQESNQNTGTKDKIDAGDSEKEDESDQDCFELPIWHSYSSTNTSASKSDNKRGGPREEEQVFLDDLARLQRQEKEANEEAEALRKNLEQETENLVTQAGAAKSSSTNIFSTVSTTAKASGKREEDIDYDEVFAPVARLEAIRIFLAFASYMGFIVYQMDVKSAFLYGKIDEEVYVSQPPGFQDPKSPEKVYKVVKALYGLHQAPRACDKLEQIHDRNPQQEVVNFLGRSTITWQAKSKTIEPPLQQKLNMLLLQAAVGKFYGFKINIHTDDNVADLLTKALDVSRFQFLVVSIGMSKNTLVKHFEDMRICKPSKEYFQIRLLEVILVNALRRFRESLRRVTDGAEAFLILTLFILCLDKVTQTYKNPFQSHTYSSNLSNCHSSLQALISLTDDLSLLINMAALESCPKHNMIAYLEKTEGNVEFHEVIDFLRRSYIYHALTVVSISEASIRTDLIFDDADGIDTLPNQAIFNAIQRMGYEGDLNKGKRFSGKVTPLFDTMLVQPTQDEGDSSERLSAEQSSPSPAPTSEVPNESLPDSTSAQPSEVSDQAKEIQTLKAKIKKLKKQATPVIKHFKAYLKTVSLQKRIPKKDSHKQGCTKEKKKKICADDQIEDTEENIEGNEEIFESTEEPREGTEEKVESTAGQTESTEDQTKEEIATQASQTSTQTPTSMIFGDDETIATLLLNMSKAKAVSKEKEKGVELKDVEDIDRPRPTTARSLLTLKPLPKIDPKDKGKKKIEEEDETESEDDDIPQAVKKFKQLESDEELARKVQEEWEAEEEKNRLAEEEATNEALIKNFDDIKARIEADRILAEKLQEQEREQVTEATKPTSNQESIKKSDDDLLKTCGTSQHSELKSKKFEDIQAMYEKIKRSDKDFIAIGSVEDESLIKRMNKKDSSKEEEIKQESKEEVKQEDKEEENTRKRKQGTRKKMKSRKRRFKQDTSQDDPSDIEKENDELRLCLTIAPDEDKEVDYEILDKKYPIIDWKTQNFGTKPQLDESKSSEEINLNVVTRSNGQKRFFSTLIDRASY
ncbi:putative ribonuclease H-like domain-containing protein [Tanacetum coccineum]